MKAGTNRFDARFVSTRGEWLEAIIEVDGRPLRVMDAFSAPGLTPGQRVRVELEALPADTDDWHAVFAANPRRLTGLLPLDGWRYHALERVLAVDPVICHCGLLCVEAPVASRDARCIGAYIGFDVDRLTARAVSGPA